MGKKILRAAMGVIFLFVFLAFLLTSAVKFRLISSDFWKTALVKGKVYEQLQVKIKQMGVELEKETRKQSQTVPKELQTLVNLEKQLDETRLRELVETNIERLIGYVTGETAELKLYLPITEWKLPVARLGQPGLAKLNAETPVGEVLGSLGFKEEQTKQVTEKLVQTRKIVMGLTEVWLILLVLTIGLLLLHFSLGEGMADRVWGTGLLLIVVGLLVKLIGVGAGQIFELISSNSKQAMTQETVDLVRILLGQFFSLGESVGLIVAVVGVGLLVVARFLFKSEKKVGLTVGKSIIIFGVGVSLGVLIIVGLLVGTVLFYGGGVNFELLK